MIDEGLAVYVVYADPIDCPGKFVVRRRVVTPTAVTVDREPLGMVDSLDQARALLPIGLHRIERSQDDEPQIVETWL